ncbi:hypothetical protein BP00DRAFT_426306 [Aspergillus indologenus CBS 114.80]|uniref:Polysaccharide lyase family 20 protein n=1 Tax=Aspergillus indologenus CBS 114.80 TaxID=1450541 RepID=A0A2V5I8R0_9EURO|nr:hypothetical protein BP00DRAFT_426306 [Aspergillus indologenus CBS 114.80]
MLAHVLTLTAFSARIPRVGAGTLFASDFSSSSTDPFSLCNYKSPSTGTIVNQALHLYFDESGYDGTRDDRGVEICRFDSGTKTNTAQMTKEGWQGFNLYVPADDFPSDKSTIIAQQFCPAGCISWCGTLEIAGNALVVNHRSACGGATTVTIVDDIPRDQWHAVVIRMRVSAASDGAYEVWWDGAKVYSATGINVGFGTWNDDDGVDEGWYFKNGMYAFDYSDYNDATRTLYFDNVSWYQADSGESDGYDTVAPTS